MKKIEVKASFFLVLFVLFWTSQCKMRKKTSNISVSLKEDEPVLNKNLSLISFEMNKLELIVSAFQRNVRECDVFETNDAAQYLFATLKKYKIPYALIALDNKDNRQLALIDPVVKGLLKENLSEYGITFFSDESNIARGFDHDYNSLIYSPKMGWIASNLLQSGLIGGVYVGEPNAILEHRLNEMPPEIQKEWAIINSPSPLQSGYEAQRDTLSEEINEAIKNGKKLLAIPISRPSHAVLAIVNLKEGERKIEFYESNAANSEMKDPWVKRSLDHIKKVTGIERVEAIITKHHQGSILDEYGRNDNCGIYACYFAEKRMRGLTSEGVKNIETIPIFEKRSEYITMLANDMPSANIYKVNFTDELELKKILLDDLRVERGLESVDNLTLEDFSREYHKAKIDLIVKQKRAALASMDYFASSFMLGRPSQGGEINRLDFGNKTVNDAWQRYIQSSHSELLKADFFEKYQSFWDQIELPDISESKDARRILKVNENILKHVEAYNSSLFEEDDFVNLNRNIAYLQGNLVNRYEERAHFEEIKAQTKALIDKVKQGDALMALHERYGSSDLITDEDLPKLAKDLEKMRANIKIVEAKIIQENQLKEAVLNDSVKPSDISVVDNIPERLKNTESIQIVEKLQSEVGSKKTSNPKGSQAERLPNGSSNKNMSDVSSFKAVIPNVINAFASMFVYSSKKGASLSLNEETNSIQNKNCKDLSQLNLESHLSILADSLEFSSLVHNSIVLQP